MESLKQKLRDAGIKFDDNHYPDELRIRPQDKDKYARPVIWASRDPATGKYEVVSWVTAKSGVQFYMEDLVLLSEDEFIPSITALFEKMTISAVEDQYAASFQGSLRVRSWTGQPAHW